MGPRFVNVDRDTPLLLPVDLRDWVPANHLAHFILDLEVEQLLAKAESADATPLEEGLRIPDEIVRRQKRKAALAKARAQIEARAQARYAKELAEHQQKLAERQVG